MMKTERRQELRASSTFPSRERRGLRRLDQHVPALDLDLEDLLLHAATQGCLAGADVELPAVPGAGDRRPFERSVGERAALVRADAVDGRDRPAEVEQRVD